MQRGILTLATMSKSSKRIILPQYIFEGWRNPVFFFHKRKLQLLVKFKFHDLRQSDSDKRRSHEAGSEVVETQHIFYHRWHLRTLRLRKQGRIIVESCCRDGHPLRCTPKSVLQKRSACVRRMQFKGLGLPNKHFELGFEKSNSKIASWYQLALLAANANAF